MLDDSDLRRRFQERDATLAPPDERLFARVLARIDEPRKRPWFAPPVLMAATAIAFVAALFVIPRGPATSPVVPPVAEYVKLDPMPAPPPTSLPKQIKIDTMHAPAMAPEASSAAPSAASASQSIDAGLARSGSIELLVPRVEPALAAAQQIAVRQGGTVTTLHDAVAQQAGVSDGATLTIVVPAPAFGSTIDALARLGEVRARSIGAEAVGGSIVDNQARLRNLRREENDLLAIMHRSGSVGDILAVEDKLSDVRGQIEGLEAELADLHHRVATATIDVSLVATVPAPPPAMPWGGLLAALALAGTAAVAAWWVWRQRVG